MLDFGGNSREGVVRGGFETTPESAAAEGAFSVRYEECQSGSAFGLCQSAMRSG